ncbi:hypothetical protein [Pyrococcus kukulkanii]|uniref:Uncharacterized protein n=1 Tax=Pyrococcus kukulkanii TaxID=1609559 RepID=A0A127BAV9_9EURY|nr:hypothetical protein [Pyrococcus kukulkanii]AMM54387.1 hypothetical protein TQ32_07775 [Pyrococcus kukulkanii]
MWFLSSLNLYLIEIFIYPGIVNCLFEGASLMDAGVGTVTLLSISLLVYLLLRAKGYSKAKAGLSAIITYMVVGIVQVELLDWSVSPWVFVISGIFVAFLDIIQLRMAEHHQKI